MNLLLQTNIPWLPLLTIQAPWIEVITGLLSRTYTPLLGTLVLNQFLMLKKILSKILHHTSFFTAKYNFFPGSNKKCSYSCKGVFSFQKFSLVVTTSHITPVLYGLRLFPQFSDITALQSLVWEKKCKGAYQVWSCLWRVMASHTTPVCPTLSCGKVECWVPCWVPVIHV